MEGRESAPEAETLRIAGIHAGNKWTHEAIEKLRRKFPADEGSDGFVSDGRTAFSKKIANQTPFGGSADQRASEKGGRAQRNGPKRPFNQDVARRAGWRLDDLIRNAEFLNEHAELRGCAETLRTQFDKKAVARDGLNDAAGTWRGFKEMRVNAGFAESIGADEAGNSAAGHQRLDVTGHSVLVVIVSSESF